jgi:Ca-activated chloride channel family protein
MVLRAARRRRALAKAVDPELVGRLTPDYSAGLVTFKQLLVIAGSALLLLAAARPKWGEKLQLYGGKGIDLVIALDASKSMLARDVSPNRLTRAKTELSVLLDELAGNAVGIVAFAGDARLMCPLTPDLDAAGLFLDIISPDVMPLPGTDFGRAIDEATAMFNPEEPSSRAIVLVTDGDDLGKNTGQAVQRAIEAGVRIYPVAFASPEGAMLSESTPAGIAYKTDRTGNPVVSRMNEHELIMMAQVTGGRFLRMEGYAAQRLVDELGKLRKKDIGGGAYAGYVERYQPFLLAGFLLVLAGLALSNRRGRWLDLREGNDAD